MNWYNAGETNSDNKQNYIYAFIPLNIDKDASGVKGSDFKTNEDILPGVYVGFVSRPYGNTADKSSKYPVGILLYRHIGFKFFGSDTDAITARKASMPDNLLNWMYPMYTVSDNLTNMSLKIYQGINVIIRLSNGKCIKSGFESWNSNNSERDYIYISIDDVDNPKFYLDELMFNISNRSVGAYEMKANLEGSTKCDTIIIDGKNKGEYPLDTPN